MSNFQIRSRRPARPLYYLAPAIALLAVFFLAPIIVNIVIAFTDMGANLRVGEFTLRNFERIVQRDARIPMVLLTTLIYVTGHAVHFQYRPRRASGDHVDGDPGQARQLLPRVVAAAAHVSGGALCDPVDMDRRPDVIGPAQSRSPAHSALPPLNLRNDFPLLLVILANGVVGASFAMVILTSSVRSIPAHLANAARVDGRPANGACSRHVVAPALSQPIRFITIYQALSLLTTYEYILLITGGGPVYDSTPYALYIYRRAFDNGAYAYGAALALGLMVIGIAFTLVQWRVTNMRDTFAAPKIEVL